MFLHWVRQLRGGNCNQRGRRVGDRFQPKNAVTIGRNHAGDLADDKIYVAGGYGNQIIVEFDLVLEEMSVLACPRVAPLGKKWMTADFAEWRREILFFGGIGSHTNPEPRSNEIHAFNVDSKGWKLVEMKGEPPIPRTGQTAVIKGFDLFVYGGYDTSGRYLHDFWIAHLKGHTTPFWSKMGINTRVPIGRTVSNLKLLGWADDSLWGLLRVWECVY